MRTPSKILYKLVGIIILVLILTSCSRASTQVVDTSLPGEVTAGGQNNQSQEDSENQAGGPSEVNADVGEISEDIPIMQGGRRLEVARDGSNISYEVDGKIEDVVAFYQEQLPEYGWEMTRSPDNVVGAMATMARVNENGDRLTFQLQYNPMGEFVVIRIVRLAAP